MAGITEVYVDPSIAADSGTGTIGDPFGDLEYAIEQTTFDTTNGTRFNIKAGTAEVLAAQLDTAIADTGTTPAYVMSESARLVLQGYTSAAGDGGIASIDVNAIGIWVGGVVDYMTMVDLHCYNGPGGSVAIASIDNYCEIINCLLECGAGGRGLQMDLNCYIADSIVVGEGGSAIEVLNDNVVERCIAIGNNAAGGISCSNNVVVKNNIVIINNTNGNGIATSSGTPAHVSNNSIYCSVAGTGSGITLPNAGATMSVMNNLIEGFTGVGGIGIDLSAADTHGVGTIGGNAVYNCTTIYSNFEDGGFGYNPSKTYGDNETLTVSPFNDAANDDFSPVDTGNVKEGALPTTIGGVHAIP